MFFIEKKLNKFKSGKCTYRCQFHQRFTQSFYEGRSQKCKNDSQVIGHFALFGSTHIKAAHKHVGEIDPLYPQNKF